jgi:Type IV secretion system pilin
MIKKLASLTMSFLLMFSVMSVPAMAAADSCGPKGPFSGFPTWHKYITKDPSDCTIRKLDTPGDLYKIAVALLELLLTVAGVVAFGAIIWMGFKFTLARGNSSEMAKARQGIIDAAVGFAIASLAAILVSWLGRTLGA